MLVPEFFDRSFPHVAASAASSPDALDDTEDTDTVQTWAHLATQAVSVSRAPALYKQAWDEAKRYLLSHHVPEKQFGVMRNLADFAYDCRQVTKEELTVLMVGFAPNTEPSAERVDQVLNMGMVIPLPPDSFAFESESGVDTLAFLDEVMTCYSARLADMLGGPN